jgi:site-specific recombinase XerD
MRDSPDESQTGINVRVFPALLQERREVLTATSTSRNPNAWSSYFGSATFANLAESTHRTRRQILERFRAEHGDKAIATLRKTHVERMVNAKATTPGAALNFLGALRALMRHAITVGLRADDPTVGIRGPKFKSAGFYTWTEAPS